MTHQTTKTKQKQYRIVAMKRKKCILENIHPAQGRVEYCMKTPNKNTKNK